ncbi:MAG TPA: phosphate signaling complex protein PhoU [Candidatus Dormibacteraeota bacterium]|nr:phosphate signaling complex protein PhoU [Candidatus Dormibacteraeota bacterium]
MTHFEQELASLKEKLLTMASHAEAAVKNSVLALTNRDYELAEQVRANDGVIDRFEIEVDDLAIHLLSKAPLASDLRLIVVASKISQNLERVGDEASKIANRARELSQEAPVQFPPELQRISTLALQMLKDALDCFVNSDPTAARALIVRDREVDALNKKIYRDLAQQMISSPELVTRCLNLMVAAKSLERIADHAKNVAEEVVYLCEAEDIRHPASAASEAKL